MKILSIDTSAKVTSVAIVSETAVLAEYSIDTKLTHSQALMPMVHSICSVSAIPLNSIDGFAVAVGPGSFTGLRISIGAIKGMAYALSRPCVGVSTLQGLALNLTDSDGIICATMDARCNQVYTAIFECSGGSVTRLCEDMAVTTDELLEKLTHYKKNIFLVGDGADLCYNKFKETHNNIMLADKSRRYQRASSIGFAAMVDFLAENTVSAAAIMPTYLRIPQAERELKEKNKVK